MVKHRGHLHERASSRIENNTDARWTFLPRSTRRKLDLVFQVDALEDSLAERVRLPTVCLEPVFHTFIILSRITERGSTRDAIWSADASYVKWESAGIQARFHVEKPRYSKCSSAPTGQKRCSVTCLVNGPPKLPYLRASAGLPLLPFSHCSSKARRHVYIPLPSSSSL